LRKLASGTRRTHNPVKDQVYIGINKWVHRKNVLLSQLLTCFKKLPAGYDINTHLLYKHPSVQIANIIGNPFVTIKKMQKDVKIRNLQFKMLHNIYPTMLHLNKWKIKPTDVCTLCQIREDLRHAIFDCPIATRSIALLNNLIREKYRIDNQIHITYENILFGLTSSVSDLIINKHQKSAIDACIIKLKQKLILQRENKFDLTIENIKDIFVERERIEKYISVKNMLPQNRHNKWGF